MAPRGRGVEVQMDAMRYMIVMGIEGALTCFQHTMQKEI